MTKAQLISHDFHHRSASFWTSRNRACIPLPPVYACVPWLLSSCHLYQGVRNIEYCEPMLNDHPALPSPAFCCCVILTLLRVPSPAPPPGFWRLTTWIKTGIYLIRWSGQQQRRAEEPLLMYGGTYNNEQFISGSSPDELYNILV